MVDLDELISQFATAREFADYALACPRAMRRKLVAAMAGEVAEGQRNHSGSVLLTALLGELEDCELDSAEVADRAQADW